LVERKREEIDRGKKNGKRLIWREECGRGEEGGPKNLFLERSGSIWEMRGDVGLSGKVRHLRLNGNMGGWRKVEENEK